jgi:hypothetical protein
MEAAGIVTGKGERTFLKMGGERADLLKVDRSRISARQAKRTGRANEISAAETDSIREKREVQRRRRDVAVAQGASPGRRWVGRVEPREGRWNLARNVPVG